MQALYNTYYAPYQSYLHPLVTRTLYLGQSVFFKFLYPTGWAVYSVVSRVSGGDTSEITLYSLFFTVLAGFASLWVMNAIRRRLFALVYSIVMFIVWSLVITLGMFAYYRGMDQTISDVSDLINMFVNSQQKGRQRGATKARQREWEAGKTRRWA